MTKATMSEFTDVTDFGKFPRFRHWDRKSSADVCLTCIEDPVTFYCDRKKLDSIIDHAILRVKSGLFL